MIGHIAFVTDKMEETIHFYHELFGFRKGFSLNDTDGNPWIEYLINNDGNFIELFYATPNNNQVEGNIYSHFCIETQDILSIVDKAKALNIQLYKPLKTGLDCNMQCWFLDPNGLKVEVMQMSSESPQIKLRQAGRAQ